MHLVLNCYFVFFTSRGAADKVRCSINVNYQSLADVELVLLQDKLLHPTTQTTLHSMTSENGKIILLLILALFCIVSQNNQLNNYCLF